MAWERFACNSFPRLVRATVGVLRCRPKRTRSEDMVDEGMINYEGEGNLNPLQKNILKLRETIE
eukprot:1633949-Alexandrium_andersonii.AAC.1